MLVRLTEQGIMGLGFRVNIGVPLVVSYSPPINCLMRKVQ